MSTGLLFLNKIPNVRFTPQATPTMRNTTFWSNFFSSSGDSHVGSQNYTMDLNAGMIIYWPRADVQSMQDGIWNLPVMRSLLSYSEVQRMYLFPLVGSWKILLAPHMHLTQTCAAVYLQLLRTGHTICTSWSIICMLLSHHPGCSLLPGGTVRIPRVRTQPGDVLHQ